MTAIPTFRRSTFCSGARSPPSPKFYRFIPFTWQHPSATATNTNRRVNLQPIAPQTNKSKAQTGTQSHIICFLVTVGFPPSSPSPSPHPSINTKQKKWWNQIKANWKVTWKDSLINWTRSACNSPASFHLVAQFVHVPPIPGIRNGRPHPPPWHLPSPPQLHTFPSSTNNWPIFSTILHISLLSFPIDESTDPSPTLPDLKIQERKNKIIKKKKNSQW